MYGEQLRLRVNFFVIEDHGSSAIDTGLLLATRLVFFFNHRHKHSNKSWNDSLRVAYQGLSQLFLKTFAAVFPDSTGSPRMGVIC